MNIGVQFLREHMPKACSLHYSILDAGGISPNVVQPTAKVLYMVRGDNVRSAKALLERVNKIAQGAALMTETSFVSRQIDGTSDTVSNTVLEQLLYKNLQEAPLPTYTQAEEAFAAAIKATCGAPVVPGDGSRIDQKVKAQVSQLTDGGKKPINDFVMPYVPSNLMSPGSTDVGDVSWLTPTAQFTTATWVSGSPGHSWQNVATGRHSIAHKGVLLAAKVLAGAVADLLEQPQLLTQAREEFSITTAEGYDCPIGKEVTF
jgi:aminobenzoyl-glutamate utilization protein B